MEKDIVERIKPLYRFYDSRLDAPSYLYNVQVDLDKIYERMEFSKEFDDTDRNSLYNAMEILRIIEQMVN